MHICTCSKALLICQKFFLTCLIATFFRKQNYKTLFRILLFLLHDLESKKEMNHTKKDVKIALNIPGKEFDDVGLSTCFGFIAGKLCFSSYDNDNQ